MTATRGSLLGLLFGLALPLTGAVAGFPQDARPGEDADPRVAAGSLAVAALEFPDLADERRDERAIPIKVHLPDGDSALPLVVFSHGGGGTWDAHLLHARHLASHGYVALCVEHVDSNAATVRRYAAEERGRPRDRVMRALERTTRDARAVLGRPPDVSFGIDRAEEWNRNHPRMRGRIDTSRIAVIGHSFGAYTVLTLCGARPSLDHLEPAQGSGMAEDLSDGRVTAGVAMSPQGPGTSRFGAESYRTIRRPLLCFSGSRDEQLGHDGSMQPPEVRLEGFRLMPEGDKYFLWLENADHMAFAFADGSLGDRFPSDARADTQRICFALTLAFCDVYLKGREGSRRWLTEEYADSLCGQEVPDATMHRR